VRLHRLGVTTIYVTHDQTGAMTLGPRDVLNHGRIQQVHRRASYTRSRSMLSSRDSSAARRWVPARKVADGVDRRHPLTLPRDVCWQR
jgi:ABC-type sulfate/molybdate transport systems ATPase subunit